MKLEFPELSLVVLVGTSGSGKSTFARKYFKPTEILSSDHCRGLVSDDENDQTVTKEAFEILHYIASKRLAAGKLVVVDATNVQAEARKPLVALARKFHVIPTAIVLNTPEKLCQERNENRPDRNFGPHVIRQQNSQLKRSLKTLKREGFRHIHVLSSQEQIDSAIIDRQPLWNNRKVDSGPFDIVGDVHGCFDELILLLKALGYAIDEPDSSVGFTVTPPEGRKLVFVGDLVDRGPKVPEVLNLVMRMVEQGSAICVPGNHDVKLMRKLRGKHVQITHGLFESLEQLETYTDEYKENVADFVDSLVSHYVFDGGKLVVAHAGLKEEFQGRGSGAVREFALYGETTGETDEFGLPVRYNWAAEYRGKATVVYGHTPIPRAEWLNNTINIDTGCVFGGDLTALRYPERELVHVPAFQTYAESAKPFLFSKDSPVPGLDGQQLHDDLLDMEDVSGKLIITTRLHHNVTVRSENSAAALEVMSRFAANPKWLIYLPPTMSPCETSQKEFYLEHPEEAFAYYRQQGVSTVLCEEKHMGSRAVFVVCKNREMALNRFGVMEEESGICYTRTGRRFFHDLEIEEQMLQILRDALNTSGFWEEFQTDWVCLDCELMPWSAKAQELIRSQYAVVGAATRAAFPAAIESLQRAQARTGQAQDLVDRYSEKFKASQRYVEAYQGYCWEANSVDDYKLAPFHILATEGSVHTDKPHSWHMDKIAKFCDAASSVLISTKCREVDIFDEQEQLAAINWWEAHTASGGEGLVVKPMDFITKGKKGLVQPAMKCRGKEYLRIIYGPEYDLPENLERLKHRGLASKRSLALREFALGIEALERFVRKEPLRRVHECVFGVLALESEPVDPRL